VSLVRVRTSIGEYHAEAKIGLSELHGLTVDQFVERFLAPMVHQIRHAIRYPGDARSWDLPVKGSIVHRADTFAHKPHCRSIYYAATADQVCTCRK